jgi:hypothetical protein
MCKIALPSRHVLGHGAVVDIGQYCRGKAHDAVNGVIFSDGVEADYLEFNAGMNASISLAERYGQLVC